MYLLVLKESCCTLYLDVTAMHRRALLTPQTKYVHFYAHPPVQTTVQYILHGIAHVKRLSSQSPSFSFCQQDFFNHEPTSHMRASTKPSEQPILFVASCAHCCLLAKGACHRICYREMDVPIPQVDGQIAYSQISPSSGSSGGAGAACCGGGGAAACDI